MTMALGDDSTAMGHTAPRPVFFGPQPTFAQGTLDGLAEPAKAVFEEEVCRALLHGTDGDIFANGSRHDDEGYLRHPLAQQGEGAQGIKLRQIEIGQDQIRLPGELDKVIGFIVHPLPIEGQTGLLQLVHHQSAIGCVVFHNQDMQWIGHDHYFLPVSGLKEL